MGISAVIDEITVLCGNRRLMIENNIYVPDKKLPGTAVYVAADGEFTGVILISDAEK